MKFIRQGATHKVVIGPAVAVGDGFTPVTTLALSSADEAEAILHDNGTVVDISGYTWAAITTADGYYHLTLQSGISGTVGHLSIVINDDSLVLPLREDFVVMEEAVYDALFAANANAWTGAAGSSIGAANLAQISGDATAADTLELFAEALDQSTGQIDPGTFTASAIDANALATDAVNEIRNAVTGGAYALSTDANGRIRIVDGTGTGELDTTSGGVLVAALSTAAKAEVQTEAEEAIVTYNLDHLLAVGAATTDVANSSVIARMTSKNATPNFASFVNTTDSLEAIKDYTASEATLGSVSTNVDNAYLIVASGTHGNAALKALIDIIDANVDSVLDDTGTSGVVVNAAGLATDAVQEIRNAITGGAYALDTDANGRVRVVDGTSAGEINTDAGTVAATVAALTDARAEPGQGEPSASASALSKLDWLYFAWRNKKESTSDYLKIFDNAGTTVVTKSAKTEDGTTFTAGKFATGP